MYVSVTGLEIKSWLAVPGFYYHTWQSYRQARQAPGLLHQQLAARGSIQHTLTVWRSKTDMQRFMRSGAHLQAMKLARSSLGSYGKVVGYDTDRVPTWDEAWAVYDAQGRVVYDHRHDTAAADGAAPRNGILGVGNVVSGLVVVAIILVVNMYAP